MLGNCNCITECSTNITFFRKHECHSQFIKAPGLTHFPHRTGVVAMVTVTMTSAPDAASSTVEQAFALISSANFCALAKVLLHTLT